MTGRGVSRRLHSRPGPVRVGLMIVPLIDVVFLLLAFFLLTANFRAPEGFLPAALGQVSGPVRVVELEPLSIRVGSGPGGRCRVEIVGVGTVVLEEAGQGGSRPLVEALGRVLLEQGRRPGDPVRFEPEEAARWEDVVRVYDVLWRLGMDEVTFVVDRLEAGGF